MKDLRAWLVFALLTAACSSEAQHPVAQDSGTPHPGPYDTCAVDSDCAWGEIDHEIERAKDCTCLYGCPYLPLAKSTVARRAARHEALCDPQRAGDGELCGIDDCATPPRIACNEGVCEAASAAGN